MKKIKTIISLIPLLALLFIASCDKPVVVPETERVTTLMSSGTWKISSVTIDGASNNTFAGMSLVYTKTSYTSTNGGVVWPASGTWLFKNETAKTITRSDGLEITIDSISETAFILSFLWAKGTLGGGRSNSVAGKHVFTFKK